MAIIRDDITVSGMLEAARRRDPARLYLRFGSTALSVGELAERVEALAGGLHRIGLRSGDRVPVMLANSVDHVVLFFALQRLGVVQVPVNTGLRADGLAYLLRHCDPRWVVAEVGYSDQVRAALAEVDLAGVLWRGGMPAASGPVDAALEPLLDGPGDAPPASADPSRVMGILYTSGTTGPPKGVQVTDKMLRAAAWACAQAADARAGDTLLMWEPIYHIGGSQVLVLALEHAVTLGMVERFSASRYWSEVRELGATQIHYLGGILQILLRQPPRPDDRDHPARVAYGGGAPAAVWRDFADRFGVQVREVYGMTEASSFTSINTDGRFDCTGRPAPYFDVRIADADGHAVAVGTRGEILVREREPGLITPGYFRNPEATARALRDGWLHTGDVGWLDEDGYLHYAGRTKDAIRHRGENVSAWEVERVVDQHPQVQESAVIGVTDELGDESIKLLVKPTAGSVLEPAALLAWCETRLAAFQVPTYLAFVDDFERTATQRIRKETLARGTEDCWRRERDGRLVPPAG
ncbi:MAG: AMP-binding protein [Chromatiales bacterium]|nr:AMP-binding protein [Chromatiales bacterium]